MSSSALIPIPFPFILPPLPQSPSDSVLLEKRDGHPVLCPAVNIAFLSFAGLDTLAALGAELEGGSQDVSHTRW